MPILPFICCGVRFGIRVNDPGSLARVTSRLPPGSTPSRGRVGRVFGLNARPDLEAALDRLGDTLEFHVATATQSLLFVHAGVVAWRGRAILIPGRSMSGKTTLVAALVRAGAVYYSDEFAVLDRRGRVHPWARPLMVRYAGSARSRPTPVHAFGGRAGRRPLPVGTIVVTKRTPGSRWRPNPLSPGEALLALFDNTAQARTRPADALKILHAAVRRARAFETPRAGVRAAVDALLVR